MCLHTTIAGSGKRCALLHVPSPPTLPAIPTAARWQTASAKSIPELRRFLGARYEEPAIAVVNPSGEATAKPYHAAGHLGRNYTIPTEEHRNPSQPRSYPGKTEASGAEGQVFSTSGKGKAEPGRRHGWGREPVIGTEGNLGLLSPVSCCWEETPPRSLPGPS